jgi:DNA-binding protein H-NS
LSLEILGLDGNAIPRTLLHQLKETYGTILQEIHENSSDAEDESDEEEEEEQDNDSSEAEDIEQEEDEKIDGLAKELSEIGIKT